MESTAAHRAQHSTTQHIYRLALEAARRRQLIAYNSKEVWIGLYVRTQVLGITLQYSSRTYHRNCLVFLFVKWRDITWLPLLTDDDLPISQRRLYARTHSDYSTYRVVARKWFTRYIVPAAVETTCQIFGCPSSYTHGPYLCVFPQRVGTAAAAHSCKPKNVPIPGTAFVAVLHRTYTMSQAFAECFTAAAAVLDVHTSIK